MCLACWKTCSRKKVIELPECKHSKKMGRVNNPNYFHYLQIVNHLVEKCFILKDLIMKLSKQKRIHLDLNEVVGTRGMRQYYPTRVTKTKANTSVMSRHSSSLLF